MANATEPVRMAIQVEIDKQSGQGRGDWLVRNGPGGQILSRHRLKSAAVKAARKEARKRGTDIRAQKQDGTWSRP